ncbi:helix-turn-helix domain-containing protein [Amycolatopsis sp. 195334CR]|uniref:AraC-like ligand-binding domain-containing protein n=1 Tax=Amycolatopsis sp. 195334CR TaxID=2814588 RepID=UPI001A8C7C8F|nr:helix-turn-helix domain-containing protein [Amycolatopsis sp. 195334CR]MBN6040995.1 helix-turn-helix domain-containing protein [Amycolatopsis sp. 195334CR]
MAGAAAMPVPPSSGFDDWEHRICRTFVPLRAHRPDGPEFRGGVGSANLGSVVLAGVSASCAVVERTRRLIRQDDPELYKFGLQVSGTSVVEQDDRQARLTPGDLAIYDTSRPYRISFSDDFRMTVAMFPRKLVRLPEQRMAGLTAVRLAGDSGLGSLIAPLLKGLGGELDATTTVIATHLGDAVVDLVTAAFAQQLQQPLDEDDSAARRALRARVGRFIDDHLADPDLTSTAVAEAHFVSVRHLQKVFEAEGVPVSALIRSRRLEHCRRDLADPRCAHLPIAAIGRRWGFTDAAHFSRLFRGTFGRSPREYRRAVTARS